MSNRLSTVERMPLGTYAVEHGSVVRDSRAQAEYVMELGRGLGASLRALGQLFTWVDRRIDEATAMRDLAMMNDRMLADIGLKRSDIPLVGAAPVVGEGPAAPRAHAA